MYPCLDSQQRKSDISLKTADRHNIDDIPRVFNPHVSLPYAKIVATERF
jgi:hypothetical protein